MDYSFIASHIRGRIAEISIGNKMKNLIIGMGISGRSACYYLLKEGQKVIGVDRNFETLKSNDEIKQLQKNGLDLVSEDACIDLSIIDRIIVSPGISRTHPLYLQAIALNKEIIGEVELAASQLIEKKWIGITGTNGKTTVTLLINHILNCNSIASRALGNVGEPICQLIDDIHDEVIVAELSSYQLETLESKVLDFGLIMNITPDHLDRYRNMLEYAKAKIQINQALKKKGLLFVFEDVFKEYQDSFDLSKTFSYGYSKTNHLYTDLNHIYVHNKKIACLPAILKGKKSHDLENYLAAFVIAYYLGIDPDDINNSFSSFKKPSHRLEFVDEVNEIKFIDDSKGTNLDAVIRAVESFDEDIILIAGGVHKGASYVQWKNTFEKKVRAVFAIGQAAPLIYEDLSSTLPVHICQTLDEAVYKASSFAKKGQIVLLSPGCSSFDMFKDYAHRGEEFKKSVFKLYTNMSKY